MEEKNKDIELLMDQLEIFKNAYDEKEDEYKLVAEQMDEMKSMVEEQQKLLEDQHAKLTEQDSIISEKEVHLKNFSELLDKVKQDDTGKGKLEEALIQSRIAQNELEKTVQVLKKALKDKEDEVKDTIEEAKRLKDQIEENVATQETLSNEVRNLRYNLFFTLTLLFLEDNLLDATKSYRKLTDTPRKSAYLGRSDVHTKIVQIYFRLSVDFRNISKLHHKVNSFLIPYHRISPPCFTATTLDFRNPTSSIYKCFVMF